jgi:hypothetical protein
MPSLMNKRELAGFMGVTPRTIDNWREAGLIEGLKIRRRWVFPSHFVCDFIRRHLEG